MLAEQYKNCKVKTTSVAKISELIEDLISNRCTPVVIINLNQCLFQLDENSNNHIHKLYDPEFRSLCGSVFRRFPSNLFFITTDYIQFQASNNALLNNFDILGDSTYHRYNIIHTSGESYSEAVKKKLHILTLSSYGNPYVIYIDTSDDKIREFENIINDDRINYIFFKISKVEKRLSNLYGYLSNFIIDGLKRTDDFEICERYSKIQKRERSSSDPNKSDFYVIKLKSKVSPIINDVDFHSDRNSQNERNDRQFMLNQINSRNNMLGIIRSSGSKNFEECKDSQRDDRKPQRKNETLSKSERISRSSRIAASVINRSCMNEDTNKSNITYNTNVKNNTYNRTNSTRFEEIQELDDVEEIFDAVPTKKLYCDEV